MEHPENSAEYAGLQVNAGVAQPSIVNPYLKQNPAYNTGDDADLEKN